MTPHPDDEALLAEMPFTQPGSRPSCDRCKQTAPTTVIFLLERESGPAWAIRYCRPCTARRLATARAIGGPDYRPVPIPHC